MPHTATVEERYQFLASTPELSELAHAADGRSALRLLAERVKVRELTTADAMPAATGNGRPPPMRILVTGRVSASRLSSGTVTRALLGPGDLFGTDSVAAWFKPASFQRSAVRFSYRVVDPCCVYELEAADFNEVLGDTGPESLRAACLHAYQLALWAPELVGALRSADCFGNVRQEFLGAMCAHGDILTVTAGEAPLFRAGEVPDKIAVVLTGQLVRVSHSGGDHTNGGFVVEGTVLGANEMFAEREMEFDIVAAAPALVAMLDKQDICAAMRVIPNFVPQAVTSTGYGRFYTEAHPPIPPANVTIVLDACARFRPPFDDWTEELARTIFQLLGDAVTVVRLVDEPVVGRVRDNGGLPTVESGLQQLGATLAGLTHLADAMTLQVLIDPSHLSRPEERFGPPLFEALSQLCFAVRCSVVFDHVEHWPTIAERVPMPFRRWALPTALLPPHRMIDPQVADALDAGPAERLKRLVLRNLAGMRQDVREYVQEELGQDGARAVHWPVGSVRLAMPEHVRGRDAGGARRLESERFKEATFARWARAVTRRRVGVALGGAGALSNAAAAMIRQLEAQQIPIDMVSGTSYGTLVGAFYCTLGSASFDTLFRWAPTLLPLLLGTGWATSLGLSAWMRPFVRDVALNDLAVPLFPVGADAQDFTEWDVRGGSVAEGVRVSGSMPPGAPTVREGMRLLDGGLVADVPCQILADEGADLVIACATFPAPEPLPGPYVRIPFVSSWVQMKNPIIRWVDWYRGYMMLWHYAGYSQAAYADLVYNADSAGFNSMSFWAASAIARAATESHAMCSAMDVAQRLWQRMVPGLAARDTLLSGAPLQVAPELAFRDLSGSDADDDDAETLTNSATSSLDRLAMSMRGRPDARVLVAAGVSGPRTTERNRAIAEARCAMIRDYLTHRGVSADRVLIDARVLDRNRPSTLEFYLLGT